MRDMLQKYDQCGHWVMNDMKRTGAPRTVLTKMNLGRLKKMKNKTLRSVAPTHLIVAKMAQSAFREKLHAAEEKKLATSFTGMFFFFCLCQNVPTNAIENEALTVG